MAQPFTDHLRVLTRCQQETSPFQDGQVWKLDEHRTWMDQMRLLSR